MCQYLNLIICYIQLFIVILSQNIPNFSPWLNACFLIHFHSAFSTVPYDDPYYRRDPAFDRRRPYEHPDDFDRRRDLPRDRYDDLVLDTRPRDYRHGANRDAEAVLTGREALIQSKSIDYKHGWREEERERRRHPPERYDERDYPPEPAPPPKPRIEIVAIGDLLDAPGRDTRPERVSRNYNEFFIVI